MRAARRQANVDVFGDLCRQRLTHRHQHNTDGANLPGDTDGTDITDGTTEPVGPAAGGRRGRCGSAPSAARPAFLVVADLAALDADAPVGSGTARLHWATNRAPVELTAAAARRLACDATLRVVVTDGTEVLGVTAAHPKVSATLRAALVVRDGGCRFPACTQPAELCDAHHLIPVAAGGTTVLDNLALLCRQHHHAIRDGGWQATMHADATMTFTRRQITLTSIPRVSQHPRAAVPPPGGRPRRQHAVTRTATPPPDADAGPDPADALFPF